MVAATAAAAEAYRARSKVKLADLAIPPFSVHAQSSRSPPSLLEWAMLSQGVVFRYDHVEPEPEAQ